MGIGATIVMSGECIERREAACASPDGYWTFGVSRPPVGSLLAARQGERANVVRVAWPGLYLAASHCPKNQGTSTTKLYDCNFPLATDLQ
jgi:hypothetical protein